MKWKTQHEKDPRVIDKSGWVSKNDLSKMESKAGVYVFANSAKHVKYVGRTYTDVSNEASAAMNRANDPKGYGATLVKALYTTGRKKSIRDLERHLICYYQPPNNINGKDCPFIENRQGTDNCGKGKCDPAHR